jgi:uncharacterized protein
VTSKLISWFKAHLPTRESIAANRWLRPFAHHLLRNDLWHFNRRSVPRGVALGLFIAPIVPVAHTGVAAIAAIPVRANIMISAAITWVINPFTIPPFYYAAYKVGSYVLGKEENVATSGVAHRATAQATHWLSWLVDKSGPAALGTLILATIIAALGYLVSSLLWRVRVGRQWGLRHLSKRRKASTNDTPTS